MNRSSQTFFTKKNTNTNNQNNLTLFNNIINTLQTINLKIWDEQFLPYFDSDLYKETLFTGLKHSLNAFKSLKNCKELFPTIKYFNTDVINQYLDKFSCLAFTMRNKPYHKKTHVTLESIFNSFEQHFKQIISNLGTKNYATAKQEFDLMLGIALSDTVIEMLQYINDLIKEEQLTYESFGMDINLTAMFSESTTAFSHTFNNKKSPLKQPQINRELELSKLPKYIDNEVQGSLELVSKTLTVDPKQRKLFLQENPSLTTFLLGYEIIDPKTISTKINKAVNNYINATSDVLYLCHDNKFPYEVIRDLIKMGASINVHDEIGDTAFYYACLFCQNTKLIYYMAQNGANPHIGNKQGQTPLHALMIRNELPFRFFKEIFTITQANLLVTDTDKNTLLHCACQYNSFNSELLEYLVDQGIDVNAETTVKSTALHYMCNYQVKAVKSAQLLINKGAQVNAKSHIGNTPLHIACSKQSKDKHQMIICLIKNGASPNLLNDNLISPFYAFCYAQHFSVDVFEQLLNSGANPNLAPKTTSSWTALHIICRNNPNLKAIKLLINKGIDINCQSTEGNTPLDLLNERFPKSHHGVRQFLIENGAISGKALLENININENKLLM